MSQLPKQVREQAQEADQIEAAISAANQPDIIRAEAQPDATPTPPPEPVQTAQEQPPSPAPEAPKQPAAPTDDGLWERRYRTLQGMFDAEVPRLTAKVKELTEEIQALKSKPEPHKPAEAPKKLVTEADEQAFGSDLLDVVRRQAQEIIQAERSQFQTVIDELRAENQELKKSLGTVSERQGDTARSVYLSDMRKSVPSFDAVNNNPEFLAWLEETDPMTGLKRRAYLMDAYNAFDVDRTAAIFKAWPGFPKENPAPTPKPAQNAELARQVAPSATKSSAAPNANQSERTWSMKDIDKFYADVARGAYRGRDDEAQRIEAEIDRAVSQGRVTA